MIHGSAKMRGTARIPRIRHLLAPPVFDDEEKTRKAGLLHVILLADNLTDIIWTADLDLRFTYFSPSVIQAGYTVDEAMASSVAKLLLPESLEDATMTLAAVL